jgi:hypothetical protein
MQDPEPFEEEPAEQAREHAHGQKEAGLAGDPAQSVRRQAAAGHVEVDVRVMGHRGAPGVQRGGEADARAQMPRVGGAKLETTALYTRVAVSTIRDVESPLERLNLAGPSCPA